MWKSGVFKRRVDSSCYIWAMEALQRLHMAPVGGPFGMNHHDPGVMRPNIGEDRKSPFHAESRLIMQVCVTRGCSQIMSIDAVTKGGGGLESL